MKISKQPDEEIPVIEIKSLSDQVLDQSFDEEDNYSILKNARRPIAEITEIACALQPKNVRDIITFNFRRAVFHEAMSTLLIEAKFANSREFAEKFQDIYKYKLVPELRTIDIETGLKLEDQITTKIDKDINTLYKTSFEKFKLNEYNTPLDGSQDVLVTEIAKIYHFIENRINNGEYTPGEQSYTEETLESITEKIVKDKIFQKEIARKAEKFVEESLNELFENKELERIKLNEPSKRHTFISYGPPGSGKTTQLALMVHEAEKMGIFMNDLVKINTDAFRYLVSHQSELGDKTIQHASFTYDEAYLITKRVYQKLRNKINANERIPHIMLDTVYPSNEKIELGIMNSGNLKLNCVTVPPLVGVERTIQRGEATNRYIDTRELIKSHIDISKSILPIIINYKNQKISLMIWDNENKIELIAKVDLNNASLEVFNNEKLSRFLNIAQINPALKKIREITPRFDSDKFKEFCEALKREDYSVPSVALHNRVATNVKTDKIQSISAAKPNYNYNNIEKSHKQVRR